MMKNNKSFNLLKTMLKTSYDVSDMINPETKKLNKKSLKVWIIGLIFVIVIYLSYIAINSLKEIRIQSIFLQLFFTLLQMLVMLETVLLNISILYFSDDIQNYLCMPVSSIKLLTTKFLVMISIIFGSEIIIGLPSTFMYGVNTMEGFWFYPLTVIVLIGVSIFLSAITSIIMIFVMRLFRFIKNRYLYQNVIIFLMTIIILFPLSNLLEITKIQNTQIEESEGYETDSIVEMKNLNKVLEKTNKYLIVTELGAKALLEVNYNSIIYVLEIIGLDICALIVFFKIGNHTYIKDILYNISIFNKKKNKKINLSKRCKVKNKKISYLKNEINKIIKSPIYFMHYIYNVLIVLFILVLIISILYPIIKQVLLGIGGKDIFKDVTFRFADFSLIVGIIQLLFTLSSLSLTAISRYGKNAIFFKYIPMKFKTQFRLKNIPQLIVNTIIIITVLLTVNYLIPEINNIYILLMFIVAMLLNIINSNTLLILDLLRPQLNYENEITVIKQNDNKLFQYMLTVVSCLILWYLKEVTKDLNLNLAIFIEITVFSLIVITMEIFINKKSTRLFRKII